MELILNMSKRAALVQTVQKESKGLSAVRSAWRKNKILYLMFLPVALYYLVFAYKPMYGALIAFQDYAPMKGILGSPWVVLSTLRPFLPIIIFGEY